MTTPLMLANLPSGRHGNTTSGESKYIGFNEVEVSSSGTVHVNGQPCGCALTVAGALQHAFHVIESHQGAGNSNDNLTDYAIREGDDQQLHLMAPEKGIFPEQYFFSVSDNKKPIKYEIFVMLVQYFVLALMRRQDGSEDRRAQILLNMQSMYNFFMSNFS